MTTTEQKVQKQYTEYTYPKHEKKWDKNPKKGPGYNRSISTRNNCLITLII